MNATEEENPSLGEDDNQDSILDNEEAEKRFDNILDAIGEFRVTREFYTNDYSEPVIADLLSSLYALLGQTPSATIDSNKGEIKVLNQYNHGYFVEEVLEDSLPWMSDKEDVRKGLKIAINHEDLFNFKQSIRERLKESSPPFENNPAGFRFHITDDPSLSPQLEHITSIILGFSVKSYDFELKKEIEENIIRQLKTYIKTGELSFNKKDEIDLEKMDYRQPMVFLSDQKDKLVWKHGGFCKFCGKGKNFCYCTPVEEEFSDENVLKDLCWDCTKEAIIRDFQEDYNDKFTQEICEEERKQFLMGWRETIQPQERENLQFQDLDLSLFFEQKNDEPNPPLQIKKGQTEDEIQELIDKVNEFYHSVAVPESPRGSCSCPAWD